MTLLPLQPFDDRSSHNASIWKSKVVEVSMIDVPLTAALLKAIPDPAPPLLVGGVDHLPSVGPRSPEAITEVAGRTA
jgi:hypothetical protein